LKFRLQGWTTPNARPRAAVRLLKHKKLFRNEYQELPSEHFGELRFRRVLEKNVKYLFNNPKVINESSNSKFVEKNKQYLSP
jgi:hypothetical protein